jgi:hypothetical protein
MVATDARGTRGGDTVLDEERHDRSDDRGDEAGTLVGGVPADRLTDERREEGADDAEHRRQDETSGLFGADDNRRAMMPATKPISKIQRKPPMVGSPPYAMRFISSAVGRRPAGVS